MVLLVRNLPANSGDIRDEGLIPGSGRSSGGGHSYPLQYYYLENSMDRRAWWVTAHRIAKSWVTETEQQEELGDGSPQSHYIVAIQLLSHVLFFATLWTTAHQASLSITISQSLLKLLSVESVMPSNYLVLCCPLLTLPSIFPSVRVFLVSWLFATGGQSTGTSASALVL